VIYTLSLHDALPICLLEKVVDYEFSISKCERCKTVLEPLISTQWFCRMDQLRDLALAKLRADGKPSFVPEVPYEKVYADWLENRSEEHTSELQSRGQ